MKSSEEYIAVVHRNKLPSNLLQEKLILTSNAIDIEKIFKIEHIEFLKRSDVENLFEYKQIIPYIIIRNTNNHLLIYQRNGTEKRLNEIWSIGWGGHINKHDFENKQNISEVIIKSATRELYEEIPNFSGTPLTFLGLINEELTKVGKTHIGLVYTTTINVQSPQFSSETKNSKFIPHVEFNNYKVELWSELAFELLNKIKP